MAMGPVQVLVVGFGEDANFTGKGLDELMRLREHDIVRVIDLLLIKKNADGTLERVEMTDMDELTELGAFAGALVGLGAAGEEGAVEGAVVGAEVAAERGSAFDDQEVWSIAEAIPEGMTAAVAVLEHRWAIPLREAITDAGGVALADRWVHPLDLLAIGEEIGLDLEA